MDGIIMLSNPTASFLVSSVGPIGPDLREFSRRYEEGKQTHRALSIASMIFFTLIGAGKLIFEHDSDGLYLFVIAVGDFVQMKSWVERENTKLAIDIATSIEQARKGMSEGKSK